MPSSSERRVRAILEATATQLIGEMGRAQQAVTKTGDALTATGAAGTKALDGLGKSAQQGASSLDKAAASSKTAAKATEGLATSSTAVEGASRRLLNTQGALAVAEQRLAEARAAGNVSGARMAALEESVARGRRNVTAVTEAEATALAASSAKSAEAASHLGTLSTAAGLAGAALGAGLAFGVKSFADFDQAMSAVKAALPDAGNQIDNLRQLAIKLGADTMFSATEAAQGITGMAKAGVSAQDILGGGLKGALDLAAAGQLSVADASTIAATALNQFGLSGKDLPHVADLFAAAAGKAQGSVSDIAAAMKFVGPVAKSMGLSIEDVTAVLGEFASKGIIGEQAGTGLRGVLLSLVSPSTQARKTLDEYGISLYDSTGKLKNLAGIAQELKTHLGSLDAATRNQALGQIFGNEQITSAITLMEGGGAAVDSWKTKVNEAGYAAKQAAALTNNWRGDLERLGGSINSVLVENGSAANSVLRSLTKGAEGVVNAFGDLPAPVQGAATALTLGSAGVLLFGAAAVKIRGQVTSTMEAIDGLGLSGTVAGARLATAAKGIGAASLVFGTITVAGGALTPMWLNIAGANDDATRSLERYIAGGKDAKGVGDNLKFGLDDLHTTIDNTFNEGFTHQIGNVLDTVGKVGGVFGATRTSEAAQFFQTIDKGMAGLVAKGEASQAASLFQRIATEAQKQGVSLDQVKSKLPQYAAALDAAAASAGAAGTASSGAATGIDGVGPAADGAVPSLEAITRAAQDAATAASNLDGAIKGLGGDFRTERAAARDYDTALKTLNDDLGKPGAGKASQAQRDAVANATDRLRIAEERLNDARKKGKTSATGIDALQSSVSAAQRRLDAANAAVAKAQGAGGKKAVTTQQEQADLDALAQKTLDYAAAAEKGGKSTAYISGLVARGRAEFIKAAEATGQTAAQAKKLADNEGLIPAEVVSTIKASGVEEANKKVGDLNKTVANTPKSTTTVMSLPQIAEKRKQVQDLHSTMDRLPPSKTTHVNVTGLLAADHGLAVLRNAIATLQDRTIHVETIFTSQGKPTSNQSAANASRLLWGNAYGGPVRYGYMWDGGGHTGPGRMWDEAGIVHKDEFVHTKRHTNRPGMLAFHSDLWRTDDLEYAYARHKKRGYAEGGPVRAGAPSPSTWLSGPSSVRLSDADLAHLNGSVTETTHAPVIIQQLVGSIEDAERTAEQRRRLQALGGRRVRR